VGAHQRAKTSLLKKRGFARENILKNELGVNPDSFFDYGFGTNYGII